MNQMVKNKEPARKIHMQYEVKIIEGRTWIHACVYDSVTKALALDIFKDAFRQATKHRVCNLLIDSRGAPSIKTTLEDYDIAYYQLEQFGFERYFKIAILADRTDKTHNFFETCITNAGYICRVFSDEDLAAQWLDSELPLSDL